MSKIYNPWILINIECFYYFCLIMPYIYFSVRKVAFSCWCKLFVHMWCRPYFFYFAYSKKFLLWWFWMSKFCNYILRTIHKSNMYLQNRISLGKINMARMRHLHPTFHHPKLQIQSSLSCLTIPSLAKSHLYLGMHLSQCLTSQEVLRFWSPICS